MVQELQKLNHRHLRMIDLMLLGTFSQKQIAMAVGMTQSSINYIVNSPIFQAELEKRRLVLNTKVNDEINNNLALASEMVSNSAPHAVSRVTELMDTSPDDSVRLRAAESILKMAFGRERDISGNQASMVVVLDANKLGFLQTVAKEAGLIDGESREPTTDDARTAVIVTTRD